MGKMLLEVKNLVYEFHLNRRIKIRAVDDLSFHIEEGEVFGLVGESGSGKSTAARCVMNLYRHQGGTISYKGIPITDPKEYRKNKKMLCTKRQIIFQDSSSSLNQRMKVADIIAEPMAISHMTPPRKTFRKEAEFQLRYVGMDASCLDKYP